MPSLSSFKVKIKIKIKVPLIKELLIVTPIQGDPIFDIFLIVTAYIIDLE